MRRYRAAVRTAVREGADLIKIMGPNSAKFINRDKDLGTLEVGKLADLVPGSHRNADCQVACFHCPANASVTSQSRA